MKAPRASSVAGRVTLLQVLVVVALLAVVGAFLLPSITITIPNQRRPRLPVCMSNQKQILAAEFAWREDHSGQNRWEIFRTENLVTNIGNPNLSAIYFRPLANDYLRNPNLLVCPNEKTRYAISRGVLMNSNLSYGVRLTAMATNPAKSALIVERHLQQSGQALKPGLHFVGSGSALAWTRELHAYKPNENRGVLGFLDGHVEHRKGSKIPEAFDSQNITTNLLTIP